MRIARTLAGSDCAIYRRMSRRLWSTAAVRRGVPLTARTALASLVALGVLGTGFALTTAEASCEYTKRRVDSTKRSRAKTIVENKTSVSTLIVEIYRGSTEKRHVYLKPGEVTSFTGGVSGSDGVGKFRVQIYPQDALRSAECRYTVHEATNNLVWKLPEGETEACPAQGDLEVSCDKGFKKSAHRYDTTFTVEDPQ
jgi:hypothetical protein